MKHEMHVEFTCHWCGKTETLIFLEPVDVDKIRAHVLPPDWGYTDGGCVCKGCRGAWEMAELRLIDANALLVEVAHRNALDVIPGADFEKIWLYSTVQRDMFNIVKAAPTIDAVQVVRCKECKHFVKYDDDSRDAYRCDGYCEKIAYIMDGYYRGAENRNADDFCSWGERKKDGGASNGSDA